MITALVSVPEYNSGPTELLLIGLDILKITKPKPVTKFTGITKPLQPNYVNIGQIFILNLQCSL